MDDHTAFPRPAEQEQERAEEMQWQDAIDIKVYSSRHLGDDSAWRRTSLLGVLRRQGGEVYRLGSLGLGYPDEQARFLASSTRLLPPRRPLAFLCIPRLSIRH